MVAKYSLDEKLKERENTVILNKIEDARRFVKYFVNLVEDILNYNYADFASYFEEDKTEVELRIFEKHYELVGNGMCNCYITVCIRLHREQFSYPGLKVVKIKVADKFDNYTVDINHFIRDFINEEFITNYSQIIKSQIFKDFKYDWSYNKDQIFKRYIKNKDVTPSQCIIDCLNKYIYKNIIEPKSKTMTYNEFINSEFKLEIDKKTQRIFNRYFFENIPNIKKGE